MKWCQRYDPTEIMRCDVVILFWFDVLDVKENKNISVETHTHTVREKNNNNRKEMWHKVAITDVIQSEKENK